MTSAFDKLAYPIQKWLRSKNWSEFRRIQSEAIHSISDGESDIIISAATAGGKTEAAFLPLVSQILLKPAMSRGFDLLYIGPLKALINDQAMRLEDICDKTELPVFPWHGDVSANRKLQALKNPRGIVLITPESLEAMFITRGLEIPRLFASTQAVIIDELHSLLDNERGIQMRSLLNRLESAVQHPIRRIGLSATLGDMRMACKYLRPDNADAVKLIASQGGDSELRLKLRGYVAENKDAQILQVMDTVADHIFKNLRGSNNLVFAGSRSRVEYYADTLRDRCEKANLPQEFYPHHANLSREHREFLEKRLKNSNVPTTAICTSTLELGIDIGEVRSIAQVGAPFSVASLRQRLGRSGRREGYPAILHQYNIERVLDSRSNIFDRLRLGILRSIAMIELLLDKWCEPPRPDSLHLSTLVQQILSVIAQHAGIHAQSVYRILCTEGPFRRVDSKTFIHVLRALGSSKTELIEQSADGMLLLGPVGERVLSHHSFYAVFKTPQEFRLIADGKNIGTIPIDYILTPGMYIVFSGRRWLVQEVKESEKLIILTPAKEANIPKFGGDPGIIHDRVIEKMFELFESDRIPIYLNPTAQKLLIEGRENFVYLGLSQKPIIEMTDTSHILATRCGTVRTSTLAMALVAQGFRVEQFDGFLRVDSAKADHPLPRVLRRISEGKAVDIFTKSANLKFEKFHAYLPPELLQKDALSSRIDLESLPALCSFLLA